MVSKRFYITLNPNKDKDLVILEYLSSTYNEAETIKSILYQIAVNRYYEVKLENNKFGSEATETVESSKEVQNGTEIAIDDDIRNLFG